MKALRQSVNRDKDRY